MGEQEKVEGVVRAVKTTNTPHTWQLIKFKLEGQGNQVFGMAKREGYRLREG